MPKQTLVVMYNDSEPDLCNVLWCSGDTLEGFVQVYGTRLEQFFDLEMTEPSGSGIWKWVGEPDAEDGVEYASFLEGQWLPLTDHELSFLAGNGCLEEEVTEDFSSEEEPEEEPEEEDSEDDRMEELDF